MYKYFKELEDRENFVTYLMRSDVDRKRFVELKNIPLDKELLDRLAKLTSKIKVIDQMIMFLDENIVMNSIGNKYEEVLMVGEFFSRREEFYKFIRNDYFKIGDNDIWNIYYLLKEIVTFRNVLAFLYPNYKDFINKSLDEMNELLKMIEIKGKIKLEPLGKLIEMKWPDAWYITPTGHLYNTGMGHKEGNLIYPLYYDILSQLSKNGKIGMVDFRKRIELIKSRGYINDWDFTFYSNIMYNLPTIYTSEIELDEKRSEYIYSLSMEELNSLNNQEWYVEPNINRSYQRNLITLIIGHLEAEMSLYGAFLPFNDSQKKRALVVKLVYLTLNNLDDILVRFAGFSKISSVLSKTITTSSLNGIDDFREYLDRGWNLDIVPRIVYDKDNDDLREIDFDSLMISRYLERQLDKYDGKGKVLVFKK